MLWRTGLVFLSISAVVFLAWAVCAASLVPRYNRLIYDTFAECFEYPQQIFKLPAVLSLLVGLVLVAIGIIKSPS